MIGQDEAFKFWYNNNYLHGVFVFVGTKDEWFDPKDNYCALPSIYIEKDMPRGIDLAFLNNQIVHLLHKDGTDEQFLAWYLHIINLKPKLLLASDSENELYVNQH